ncbi:MAG: DUF3185 domain-containing protein [Acidobacteriaceae bacterium]
MKPATIVGILLIILGVVGLAMGSISYTNQKRAVSLGPLQIDTTERHTIPIPPVLGAIALIGGIALVVAAPARVRRLSTSLRSCHIPGPYFR